MWGHTLTYLRKGKTRSRGSRVSRGKVDPLGWGHSFYDRPPEAFTQSARTKQQPDIKGLIQGILHISCN